MDLRAEEVCPPWNVDGRRRSRRAVGSAASRIGAVSKIEGSLDGRRVVGNAVALGAEVGLHIAENGPVLAVRDKSADAVV